ncbi:MAG: chemotaxis protein CheX [Clostridia bacterium]|nr:chemotaxis protein CheX [Clostridia bacterium]
MDVNYINPFIEASRNVVKQVAGFDLSIGKLYIKPSPFNADGIVIVVGITGQIRGQAMFSLTAQTGRDIASAMMMGMPVLELDEFAKSALGELANMILGNTAAIFSKKGQFIDITPPTVLIGNNIEVTSTKQKTVCIPLVINENEGKIDLDISFVET